MSERVSAFTDTYLPTVNGVTYTIRAWRDRWNGNENGNGNWGWMDVVYPGNQGYVPETGEYPVASLPFPFYDGFRLGIPKIPRPVRDTDLVHVHTPFALGLSGLRLARRQNLPLVASFHTPAGEYAGYLGPTPWLTDKIRGTAETYERWFYDRADMVIVPTDRARRHLRSQVGVATPVAVIGNGVDTDTFRPVDDENFRARHGLPADGRLVGYTGRHGYEKNLNELVLAAQGLDATVVLGGDGPARDDLEALARDLDADVRFLGFLDRQELPEFYSSLDAFAFPSPIETQGLVALEANACGTPVVGVDSGALADTVEEGITGYRYPQGDYERFREAIRAALANTEDLAEHCLARRASISVDRSIELLANVYERVHRTRDR